MCIKCRWVTTVTTQCQSVGSLKHCKNQTQIIIIIIMIIITKMSGSMQHI